MERNERNTYYGAIDYVRILSSILVIGIHTAPLLRYSKGIDFIFTRIIGRVAVPFFFITTGFFLYNDNVEDRRRKTKSYIIKISKIYVLSTLLYLPIQVYNNRIISSKGFVDTLRRIGNHCYSMELFITFGTYQPPYLAYS